MFNTYAHTFIDAVQTGKKQVVTHAVKHERLATILNEFIDSQTKYTKAAVDAGFDAATSFGSLLMSKDLYSYNWFTSARK